MSRAEMYPWSLLTEVGDYFAVPSTLKPFSYMSQLIAQRNYRGGTGVRLTAVKTSYGTIILVSQVGEELPPYDFLSPEGIYSVQSKQHVRSQGPGSPLGERPTAPKRKVSEIVARMSIDEKLHNLPWWYDDKGTFVMNSKIAVKADHERWFTKQPMPGKDVPYPDYYNLDENLHRKPDLVDDEPEIEDDEFGIEEETMTLEEILATKEK
jgi:hypothetical protein